VETAPAISKYVVGLGNPGRRYRDTRHNVGFMVLKELRRRWDFGRARSRFHSRVWTGRIGACGVALVAPQTYMNDSGTAVAELVNFYKLDLTDLLVVMDDLALPPGRLRARAKGSAGGHKGLGDVLRALETEAVARLRVGIGPPPEHMDGTAYVLGTFSEDEWAVMAPAIARAADAVETWVTNGIGEVMNRFNRQDTGLDEPHEQEGKGSS